MIWYLKLTLSPFCKKQRRFVAGLKGLLSYQERDNSHMLMRHILIASLLVSFFTLCTLQFKDIETNILNMKKFFFRLHSELTKINFILFAVDSDGHILCLFCVDLSMAQNYFWLKCLLFNIYEYIIRNVYVNVRLLLNLKRLKGKLIINKSSSKFTML